MVKMENKFVTIDLGNRVHYIRKDMVHMITFEPSGSKIKIMISILDYEEIVMYVNTSEEAKRIMFKFT